MSFDRLLLEQLPLPSEQSQRLQQQTDLRGTPEQVLEQQRRLFGPQPVLSQLERLLTHLEPLRRVWASRFSWIPASNLTSSSTTAWCSSWCQGTSAPVVIARGGRYDRVLKRFGAAGSAAAGLGFSFCLDDIRDLPQRASTDQHQCRAGAGGLWVGSQPRSSAQAPAGTSSTRRHCCCRTRSCFRTASSRSPVESRQCTSLAWVAD